jgi:oligopeptide transport system substrate-binding protein
MPVADIAESVYDIRIRPGIRYQPHPALARDEAGNYAYHSGGPGRRLTLYDFEQTGSARTRSGRLRLPDQAAGPPGLHSPIFGLMSEYIIGLAELGDTLKAEQAHRPASGWTCASTICRASRWSIATPTASA